MYCERCKQYTEDKYMRDDPFATFCYEWGHCKDDGSVPLQYDDWD